MCWSIRCLPMPKRPVTRRPGHNRPLGLGRAAGTTGYPTRPLRRKLSWSARCGCGRGPRRRRGSFWLPAVWAWARTMVESRTIQSASGSCSCTVSNGRFHTSVWAQRRQHLCCVSALPKRAASVRQAAPWHAIHSTAFGNRWLSPVVWPTSSALPARCGASNDHVRSLIPLSSSTNTKLIVCPT